jgi:TPR repeat protein
MASAWRRGDVVAVNKFDDFKKAANQGDAKALYCMGLYSKPIERPSAIFFKMAADKEHADAQFQLAQCYEHGVGMVKDELQAVVLYRTAANAGHVGAQHQAQAWCCYQEGRGVDKDDSCAVELYKKAADRGLADAQCALGLCYMLGEGVARNTARAAVLFNKAASQGHTDAASFLGQCYELAEGVEKDCARAVRLYEVAANHGSAAAHHAWQSAMRMALAWPRTRGVLWSTARRLLSWGMLIHNSISDCTTKVARSSKRMRGLLQIGTGGLKARERRCTVQSGSCLFERRRGCPE